VVDETNKVRECDQSTGGVSMFFFSISKGLIVDQTIEKVSFCARRVDGCAMGFLRSRIRYVFVRRVERAPATLTI
jgi:hypothetical protein